MKRHTVKAVGLRGLICFQWIVRQLADETSCCLVLVRTGISNASGASRIDVF